MITIKKHLEQAKDSSRVNELNKIVKRGTITLNEWRETAKFFMKEDYKSDLNLKNNCKQIIEYAGLVIIEILSTGEFVFKDTKSRNLDEVENIAWRESAEKFWCEDCL
jgi:hypothetical protein